LIICDVCKLSRIRCQKTTTYGRGIQPKGGRIDDFVKFTVSTQGASEDAGKVDVNVFGPGRKIFGRKCGLRFFVIK